MSSYKSRYSVLFKAIAIVLVCLFAVNDDAWAQPTASYSPSNSTLAAQSSFNRITPFFKKNGLDFKNRAGLIYAVGRLNGLFTDQNFNNVEIRRAINKLNSQIFRDGTVRIDETIQDRKLIGKEYKCVTFNFVKDEKIVEVLFLKDYDKLPTEKQAELRKELRIKDEEKHHLDCPGLEGVWFINPARQDSADKDGIPQNDTSPQIPIKSPNARRSASGIPDRKNSETAEKLERLERIAVAIRGFQHGNGNPCDPNTPLHYLVHECDLREDRKGENAIQEAVLVISRMQKDILKTVLEPIGAIINKLEKTSIGGTLTLKMAEECEKQVEDMLYKLRDEKKRLERFSDKYVLKQKVSIVDKRKLLKALHDGLIFINQTIDIIEGRVDIISGKPGTSLISVSELLRRGRRPGCTVENKLLRPVNIRGNPHVIPGVLNNIINNAEYWAHKKNGKQYAMVITASEENGFVKFEITDNGPGISPEFLDFDELTGRQKIFNLNVTARKDGTGLGTTDAWYAMKDLGGSIEAKSPPREGATFTLRFKIDEGQRSPELCSAKDIIVEDGEETKARMIKTLVESDDTIARGIRAARAHLPLLSTRPLYYIKKEGIPVFTFSFLTCEFHDHEVIRGGPYRIPYIQGDSISQEDFFNLTVQKPYGSESVTIRDLFQRRGLGRLVDEGLPLERSMEAYYDLEKNDVGLDEEQIETSWMSDIELDFNENGEFISSGTGELLLFRKDQDAVGKKIGIFRLHFHPKEEVYPSMQDIETIDEGQVPGAIITPSGKARLWFIKDRKRYDAARRSPHWGMYKNAPMSVTNPFIDGFMGYVDLSIYFNSSQARRSASGAEKKPDISGVAPEGSSPKPAESGSDRTLILSQDFSEVKDIESAAKIADTFALGAMKKIADCMSLSVTDILRFYFDLPFTEAALNVMQHGKGGTFNIYATKNGSNIKIEAVITDHGPGIDNIEWLLDKSLEKLGQVSDFISGDGARPEAGGFGIGNIVRIPHSVVIETKGMRWETNSSKKLETAGVSDVNAGTKISMSWDMDTKAITRCPTLPQNFAKGPEPTSRDSASSRSKSDAERSKLKEDTVSNITGVVEEIKRHATAKAQCMDYSCTIVNALGRSGIKAEVYCMDSGSHYYVIAEVCGEDYVIDAYPVGSRPRIFNEIKNARILRTVELDSMTDKSGYMKYYVIMPLKKVKRIYNGRPLTQEELVILKESLGILGDTGIGTGASIYKYLENRDTSQFSSARSEAKRIHKENLKLKYMPDIPKNTILCHIITDSILPIKQRIVLQDLEKEMAGGGYIEKVVQLKVRKSSDFVEKLKKLMAEKTKEYKDEGYNVQFDVACPSVECVNAVLDSKIGIRALAFKPCNETAIAVMQVEGIILALRALDIDVKVDKIKAVREVFKSLAGKDITEEESAEIKTLDDFMRRITFTLPVTRVDYNDIERLNRIIRENIESAA